MHDPAFGTPIGGTGGTGGAGGTGRHGRRRGGVSDPCPGCSFTNVAAYGQHLAHDASRGLIYVAADAQAPMHPSSIVTVDAATGAKTSVVPVGNDPQPLALSDDGSVLWVGLAGERRVRRMTPGTTPVPGAAYSLPMLLTTGDPSMPHSLAVLPGTPSSIAVGVHGSQYGGGGVFILDDGVPRANWVQPPEVLVFSLANGPAGYLIGYRRLRQPGRFPAGHVRGDDGNPRRPPHHRLLHLPGQPHLPAAVTCTRPRETSSTSATRTRRCRPAGSPSTTARWRSAARAGS